MLLMLLLLLLLLLLKVQRRPGELELRVEQIDVGRYLVGVVVDDKVLMQMVQILQPLVAIHFLRLFAPEERRHHLVFIHREPELVLLLLLLHLFVLGQLLHTQAHARTHTRS
uniref:Secreted protein n=1 Tax=Anopheles maculatus TaxID=74869 RepID=A0A182T3B2_9DIPT